MSQHTPGPWVVKNDYYIGVDRPAQEGMCHAEVKSCLAVPADRLDEHKANARLIAAAPEMYEAIKLQLAALDGPPGDFWRMARARHALEAAIAKAKGTK